MRFQKAVGLMTVAAALSTGACATKKYVRRTVEPVQGDVTALQKATKDNRTAIGDLDRKVAVADEKAGDANKRAGLAGDAATAANKAAMDAQQRADAANSAAQQAQSGVAGLDRKLQNMGNYTKITTKQVFFAVGKSNLDKAALAELDSAIVATGGLRNYVLEVQGFADTTGNKNLNLELSRHRAESVVRYLVTEHSIPLRAIHELAVGSDFPNAVNRTKTDRRNNRRVDVTIYALDLGGSK